MATKAKTKAVAAPSPLPTVATLHIVVTPTAKAVALRGGAALVQVQLTGKPYRTTAPHNQHWWAALAAACAAGPAPVGPLLAGPNNAQGVPANFVGYCVRRGYLAGVA